MDAGKPQEKICPNCGTHLVGRYCHVCGQKEIDDKEGTFRHFLYQFFGAAFFLENNFFKSLWLLLSRPGFLAAEYLQGRRRRYMAPISLFLLINLIYFFSVSLTDLNLSLNEQINQPQHGRLARSMVERRLASRGISMEEYAERYNAQSTSLSKTLIILHAPILACLLIPVYRRMHYLFADHMIFSLYLMAFVMLFSIVMYNILFWLMTVSMVKPQSFFSISGYLQLIVYPVYFGAAIKRFYRQPIWKAVLITPLVLVLFLIAHFVYRTVLFLVVYWTT
jgi:Protein of unknown function (DUF3667)